MEKITIERVTRENYYLFDAIGQYRMTKKEKLSDKDAVYTDAFRELKNDNYYVYAARLNDKFIGYASLVYIPKIGVPNLTSGYIYLDDIYTMPMYRRMGSAFMLLEKLTYHATQKNACFMRLYYDINNIAAHDLYKKFGFSNVGDDDGDPVGMMEKRIK